MTQEDLNGPRVLVDFWASWCGPCKMMKPKMEKFAEEQSEVEVVFVNVDQETELAQRYGIRSIPTTVYMENGEIKGKKIGSLTDAQIKELAQV